MKLFDTVLIANRGEIACRIIKTLRTLGIRSVAIYSDADAQALHVRSADVVVHLGATAAESYLNPQAIVAAAQETGAQAIHPGYGFVSENPAMAKACQEAGITFIGPSTESLEVMGDKITSKNHVAAAGVPVIAGISEPGLTDEQLLEAAQGMKFPVLIKPSSGGGGKGMHEVHDPQDLADTLITARRVAHTAFGDDTLFIEQLITTPRHIEVQILADTHSNVIHLGERECSLQRRHQKVIEEAPSALLSAETRERIGQAACDTARSVNYRGAGTVEFLVSDDDPEHFYFMEMNTRLQVEHPVTEEITGVDLVAEQIRIAAGLELSYTQDDIVFIGHSVEARVYAEVPENGFLPSTGTISFLAEPTGAGVRVDSGVTAGSVIGTSFDPMISKVIATGEDRHEAFSRLNRALSETVILGVNTNLSYLAALTSDEEVLEARLDTGLIERKLPQLNFPRPTPLDSAAAASFVHASTARLSGSWRADGFGLGQSTPATYLVDGGFEDTEPHRVTLEGTIQLTQHGEHRFTVSDGSTTHQVVLVTGATTPRGTEVWLHSGTFSGLLVVADHRGETNRALEQLGAELRGADPNVVAPLPGAVVDVAVVSGATVSAGDPLVTIEAMKMEHRLVATVDGVVTMNVATGDQVSLGQIVATVTGENEASE